MRDRLKLSSSTKTLTIALIASAILLTGQVTSWAITKCYQPNPSTVFCSELHVAVSDCSQLTLCNIVVQMERKKFPDGPKEAASGGTTEEPHDCWRTCDCVADPDTGGCVSANNWRVWHPGDKTVDDPSVTCPTEEE